MQIRNMRNRFLQMPWQSLHQEERLCRRSTFPVLPVDSRKLLLSNFSLLKPLFKTTQTLYFLNMELIQMQLLN